LADILYAMIDEMCIMKSIIRSVQLEIANIVRIVERSCQFCRVSSPLTIYILVLSGFIETRGAQTPQLEDIPGYVRLYEERLLGKRAMRLW
jgi:hypothetical protein